MKIISLLAVAFVCLSASAEEPTNAYFVDGYHGGVYGHYPPGFTEFVVEKLRANPAWKINLEIEPVTWDAVRVSEPEAYEAIQLLMMDQSDQGRIEVVNPTYGQSYLFQSSGESVIRQFEFGIRKLREHFPEARFTTYSSEEPCFTSCLPQVLRSFGYSFAVLKNPNTCWGGYTSAHGGELVNWIGPDGSSVLTVPRYASESLLSNSSWQTIAFRNSTEYFKACVNQGIKHPVGMCLQDAGWRGGPWMGPAEKNQPVSSKYVTWRDYIRNVTSAKTEDDWRFSQEDVKPGLMWGSQILQSIAQQSRAAEQRLLIAEKLAAMALVDAGHPPMTTAFNEAWRNVLLTQHHDCWIVPYNGRMGNTWADQVRRWTAVSNSVSDLSVQRSLELMLRGRGRRYVRLFNPTAATVDSVVPVAIPFRTGDSRSVSVDTKGQRFATQIVECATRGQSTLLVRATLPPLGHATVELREDAEATEPAVTAMMTDDAVILESERYRIEFDLAKGGTIRSLIAKSLGNRQFVDTGHERRFNELRGHFYDQAKFHSSADQPAKLRIVENGPLRATVEIDGVIGEHHFVQRVSVTQGSPVIDCSVRIDWTGNPRIGEFAEQDGFKNRRRAAYDDRFKLLALFPSQLADQKISKNAPYDVCESKLSDTFYNSWEEIKNNVILDWVDVTDGAQEYGLALLSDHTTSYTHGPDFPLGLTLQYAGKGLWGRDYRAEEPTEVRYAIVPHAGRWDQAGISTIASAWQQPPLGGSGGSGIHVRSLIDPGQSGWEVPAMFERDGALLVRMFNAAGDDAPHEVSIGIESEKIELVELDGRVIETLTPAANDAGQRTIRLQMPRFGIRTLRFSGIRHTTSRQ